MSIFEVTPQQSDYRAAWANHAVPGTGAGGRRKRVSWRRRARRWIKDSARRLRSPFDPRFFEPLDPDRIARRVHGRARTAG